MPPEPTTCLEQLQKSIQTFNELQLEAESREKLWRYQDTFMQSINSILSDCDCDDAKKVDTFRITLEQYTAALTELFPKLISKKEHSQKDPVWKSQTDLYDHIVEVEKFNPYHDERGRFATSSGYNTFTIRTKDPGKQHWADAAISREKERSAAATPKFEPAKSKKEAVEYAKTKLGFTTVSYGTKMDIDTINHINEEITNIQDKYPEVKGAVQTLKTTTRQSVYAQVRYDVNGSMGLEIGSNLYGKGMDSLKKSYEDDVQTGFHPKGTDYRSIIHHEYGHVIAGISTKTGMGISGRAAVDKPAQNKYANSLRGRTVEKGWLFEAAQATGQKPSEIMSGISRYAQKNPAETFAEAFAEVFNSATPREPAVALVKASGWYRNY